MKYLNTAFEQLQFALRLYDYALEGRIEVENFNRPLTYVNGTSLLVIPETPFDSRSTIELACANNLTIAFGAAAITLDRSREEAGLSLPNPVDSERDQFVCLTRLIRNAFAHDIAEPMWEIRDPSLRRVYKFDSVQIDLGSVDGQPFSYNDLGQNDVGGIEVFLRMKDYAQRYIWPQADRSGA